MSVVPGSFGEFMHTAGRILRHAGTHPEQVSAAAAAYWWPDILRQGQALSAITRPAPDVVPHARFAELDQTIDWGLGADVLQALRHEPPAATRPPRDPVGLRHVSRSLAMAAEVIGSAAAARQLPVHELVPCYRQASAALLAAGQVTVRAVAFDVSHHQTALSAAEVVAATAPLLRGRQVMLSALDTVTASGTDGVADHAIQNLHTAAQHWTTQATAALVEGASHRDLTRIARAQIQILTTATALGSRYATGLIEKDSGRDPVDSAARAWDRTRSVWQRGIAMPGGAPRDLDDAAYTLEAACQRAVASPARPRPQDLSTLHESVLAGNTALAIGAASLVSTALVRQRLYGRAETLDPHGIKAGQLGAVEWMPVQDIEFRPATRAVRRYQECAHAARRAEAALRPAAPDPGRSGARTLAAALDALAATQPFGGQVPESARLHLAAPARPVPR